MKIKKKNRNERKKEKERRKRDTVLIKPLIIILKKQLEFCNEKNYFMDSYYQSIQNQK